MAKKLNEINIKFLEDDYSPNMESDDDDMMRLKTAVQSLDEIDKRIILLYADTQSQRDVAKLLGVSTSTINIRIKEIRKKIKEKYDILQCYFN